MANIEIEQKRTNFLFNDNDVPYIKQWIRQQRQQLMDSINTNNLDINKLLETKELLEVELSIDIMEKNTKNFLDHYNQLISIYFHESFKEYFKLNINECFVLSLGLMSTICQNDFKTVYILEQKINSILDYNMLDSKLDDLIKFSLNIRNLISNGNYANILKTKPLYKCFDWFLDELKLTIRHRLSQSLRSSYEYCDVNHIMELLNIHSFEEFQNFIDQINNQVWKKQHLDNTLRSHSATGLLDSYEFGIHFTNSSKTSKLQVNAVNDIDKVKKLYIWELINNNKTVHFKNLAEEVAFLSTNELTAHWINFSIDID